MIDFQAVKTQSSTFWALCNWQMDLTEFKKVHQKVTGGSAQGGFQKNENGQSAVLSIWDISYKEDGIEKKLKANLIYPNGANRYFNGIGTGSNLIKEFSWDSNKWYTLVIKSWKDNETGNTFIGEWVKDIEAKKWHLISYFDTNLKESFMTGTMSQFQESYDEKNYGAERSFKIKNIYAHDIGKRLWLSLNTAKLYYDHPSYGLNTAGTHEIIVNDDHFYASSGLKVENQEEYDERNPKFVKDKINQPDKPNFEDVSIQVKATIDSKTTMNISWTINPKTAPAYSYRIKIVEVKSSSDIKTIHTYATTRPEQNTYSYKDNFDGKYIVNVDAFGLMDQVATHSSTV
ncbi:MAG: DUF3472 domain-containing protein, partial [Bacilli bacterium]|nr:DUF3472 domain-containing protein [Bacilli bacterium]